MLKLKKFFILSYLNILFIIHKSIILFIDKDYQHVKKMLHFIEKAISIFYM